MSPNPLMDDDNRFDLLVDGELGEADRRELLSCLDREPDGWRRCALAFLEAQAWRQVLGPVAAESAEAVPPGPLPSGSRHPRRSRPIAGFVTALAMAASFAAALMVGWRVQDAWRSGGAGVGPSIPEVARHESSETSVTRPETPGEAPLPLSEQPGRAAPEVYLVDLPGGAGPGGQSQTIRLQAVPRNTIGQDIYSGLPAPISPELLRELERAGWRVVQQRGLLPLKMQDGRRLVVPVDDVNIQFVGNPTL